MQPDATGPSEPDLSDPEAHRAELARIGTALAAAFEALKPSATTGEKGVMLGYAFGKGETAVKLGDIGTALEALGWLESEAARLREHLAGAAATG